MSPAAVDKLRRELTRIGFEVGAILNTIQDDDLRDLLHGVFERTVNDELYAGSRNRAAVAPLIVLADRFRDATDADVVHIYSKRVPS